MWSLLILAYSLSLRIWPPGSAGSLAVFNTLLGQSVCHIIGVDTCSGPHLTTETHSSMAAETCSRSCRCALCWRTCSGYNWETCQLMLRPHLKVKRIPNQKPHLTKDTVKTSHALPDPNAFITTFQNFNFSSMIIYRRFISRPIFSPGPRNFSLVNRRLAS